jgi:cell shape-determining protein MreC
MNKDRLDWIVSGLNQYKLTKNEDQFIKTTLEDFNQKNALTEHQEERIESLYKEKSKLKPNKNSNYFSFAESTPQKTRPRRPRVRVFDV